MKLGKRFVNIEKFTFIEEINLNPKDLKLVKGQKLDVNCSLSTSLSSKSRISRSGYKSTQLKFAIKMPKKFNSSDSDQLSTSQSAPDEELFTTVIVPGQNVTIHDGRTANLKYDVEAFQEGNYLLICYLNKMKTADIFSVGTLPYDVINITCNVLNWSDLICTFVTSGVSSEYITKYNAFIKRSHSDKYEIQATIDSEISKTDYKFSIENFVNNGLLDAVDIYFIGTNIFGQTTSRSFNINLKDVNVVNNFTKIDATVIKAVRDLKDFTEILSPDNNELVAMEVDETLLPAFSQCSSSVRLKPLNYGLFSEWSNSPSFHTSVRVPLKNPDVEESFYSILKCSCTGRQSSCDVSFYFKPLKLEESRGPVSEYRMNISTQSSSSSTPTGNTKIFLNNTNLHNKLDNLLLSNDCCGGTAQHEQFSGSCGTSLEVTLEAATSAGYNNTIPASLYVIPFRRCLNSSTFDEKVDDVSVHVQFAPRLFDVVRINETSADIVWSVSGSITELEQHLSDSVDGGQYFIVWCIYDRFTQCKDDMSWEKVDNAKKVNIYSFSSSEHEVYNYHFGISRAGGEPGGTYWMVEHCFFNAKSRLLFFFIQTIVIKFIECFRFQTALKDVLITNTDHLVVLEKHSCNKPNENYFRRFHVSILVNNEPVRELENGLESAEIMLNANEMHETTKLIFTFYGWLNGDHSDDDIFHGDDNARSIVKRQEFHPYNRLGSTTQVNHDTWVAIVVAACVFFFFALAIVCCRRYCATSHCCVPLKIQVPARDSASLKPSGFFLTFN
ncbi:hypothetical protein HELRODRAFT_160598 [Helobdella robusta]|uniref:Uncharacterized protein n=1 Tax=Helobdella robusta TaxID=6412 RepID=T1EQG9_HELRO|nr:hypothetical protein HELRODRAFT_160598 [Helobdella robusta]ESO06429.1 hypothetical protein HELRODRAFT_160598 [Helobdella robusta]